MDGQKFLINEKDIGKIVSTYGYLTFKNMTSSNTISVPPAWFGLERINQGTKFNQSSRSTIPSSSLPWEKGITLDCIYNKRAKEECSIKWIRNNTLGQKQGQALVITWSEGKETKIYQLSCYDENKRKDTREKRCHNSEVSPSVPTYFGTNSNVPDVYLPFSNYFNIEDERFEMGGFVYKPASVIDIDPASQHATFGIFFCDIDDNCPEYTISIPLIAFGPEGFKSVNPDQKWADGSLYGESGSTHKSWSEYIAYQRKPKIEKERIRRLDRHGNFKFYDTCSDLQDHFNSYFTEQYESRKTDTDYKFSLFDGRIRHGEVVSDFPASVCSKGVVNIDAPTYTEICTNANIYYHQGWDRTLHKKTGVYVNTGTNILSWGSGGKYSSGTGLQGSSMDCMRV